MSAGSPLSALTRRCQGIGARTANHPAPPILGARQTLPFEGGGNDGRTGRNSRPTLFDNQKRLDGNDPITGIVLLRGNLSMRCLTADECDRDMPHRRIGPSAMPMAFAGLDVYDITQIDLALFILRCDHAGA